MAYDGTLKFDTSVDGGGFKNGITKIASLAKTGLKAAVTAITAVTGALSEGAAVGVKYNAQMEQYITSFGTMLGSAEKATALVNDLKEMGAKTPFETSDLAKGSQTLLAFGTAAEDLLPTLQMLGDVSQGNKERFDSLTLAFAQVGSAGKLSGQDLLQFVNAGFNPLNEICKKTGESMAEARDRMSEGGISAEEVAAAFKSATSEGGQFYRAMEAQSQTFNGQLSTLKDNVMSFIGDLTQGVTGTLKDTVLPMVNGWLGELQEAFKSGGIEGVVSALGGVLADACTRLAQAAPGVIDLAVGFIQSFVRGVIENAPKLIEAAKQIVSALVDGLVKLLPSEIQKPVRETVEILKKSFRDGGLKSAINTVANIVKNLGKVLTNVAKVILPPLAKAVDLVGRNLKLILPLVTSAVVAWKTWSVVQKAKGWITDATKAITKMAASTVTETVATGAATGAITLKQIAVGLATKAQMLWNAAMNANPIGAVITLVTTLASVIGLLCISMGEGKDSAERLTTANDNLGNSYGNIGQSVADFQEGIETAESYLSSFNDTLFASAEEQQALQDNMQEIQDGITTICKLASTERRDYTAEEIQRLDEYFRRLRELQEQQLEVERLRFEAVSQQAITEAQAFKGSLAEYEELSQRWIATAREQSDNQIKIIEEQSINELALLNQRYGDQANLSNDAYKKEYDDLISRKKEKIDAAYEEVGQITSAYAEGYAQRAVDLQTYLSNMQSLKAEEEEENQRHQERINELNKQYAEAEKFNHAEKQRLLNDIAEEEQNHSNNIADIREKYNEGLDKATEHQLGTLLDMLANTDMYGGKISDKNRERMLDFLEIFEALPEETKKAFSNTMTTAMNTMENNAPSLYAKTSSVFNGVVRTINRVLGIASPSKVAKRIFGFVMEGAESGMDAGAPSLYKKADKTATGFLKRFSPKLDVSAMVAKMKAAVAAQHSAIAPAAEASAFAFTQASKISTNASQDGGEGTYVAEVRVDLEGREIARATAPFMDSQLAFSGGL